jgi:hypothetical protein
MMVEPSEVTDMDLYLIRRRAGPGDRLQMGGLVKLEPKVERDGFSVAWAVPPDLA